jgi:alkylation response protein AidB-like acyl-CoA dehydrogenase
LVDTTTQPPNEGNGLYDPVSRLVVEEFYPSVAAWDAAGSVPRDAFERLCATGVPAKRWASPSGDVDAAVVLARACGLLTSGGAGVCFMTHVEAFASAARRCEFGKEHQEDIDAGRRIGCVGISEATSGSVVTHCATRAARTSSGWAINGHKHFVSNFFTATDCVVFVRTADHGRMDDFTVFIVPTGAAGVTGCAHELIGAGASGTAMVDLIDVEVDDSRRVGKVGAGLQFLLGFLSFERFWAAIGSVTSAELCMEMLRAWVDERRLGDTTLRDYQVIRHRLADLACAVTAARCLVDSLICQAREGLLLSGNAAMGKLYASRVAWRVADEAMQLLGGIGYTTATPIGRMWRDSRLMRIGGGTDEVLREIVGRTQQRSQLHTHPAVHAVRGIAATARSGVVEPPPAIDAP